MNIYIRFGVNVAVYHHQNLRLEYARCTHARHVGTPDVRGQHTNCTEADPHSPGGGVKEKGSASNHVILPDPHILTTTGNRERVPELLGPLAHRVQSHDRSPIFASETMHNETKGIPPHTSPPWCSGRSPEPICTP